MLQAVLFDLDGTLMDHDAARLAGFMAHAAAVLPELAIAEHDALAQAWQQLEARHYDEYAAGRISFTEQRRRRVRGLHAVLGRAQPSDAATDAWFAAYLERYRAGWVAFDDVGPALAALAAAQPGVELAIVTNGEGEPQRAKLAAIGLAERFRVFVASADVGLAKPDPAIFLLACERLGVEPAAAAHVGDRLDLDAQGAAAAGLRGIWLDRGSGGRSAAGEPSPGITRIATLRDLAAALTPS